MKSKININSLEYNNKATIFMKSVPSSHVKLAFVTGNGTLKWKHKLLFNVIKRDNKAFITMFMLHFFIIFIHKIISTVWSFNPGTPYRNYIKYNIYNLILYI